MIVIIVIWRVNSILVIVCDCQRQVQNTKVIVVIVVQVQKCSVIVMIVFRVLKRKEIVMIVHTSLERECDCL